MTIVDQTVLDYFTARGIELAEELIETRADRDSYRAMAKEAIEQLHVLTQQNVRLTEQNKRLMDENRGLRDLREAA